MKILFYGTKNYDEEFFEKLLPSYPGITIKFTEANIHEETAVFPAVLYGEISEPESSR